MDWDARQSCLREEFAAWHERLNAVPSPDPSSDGFCTEKWQLMRRAESSASRSSGGTAGVARISSPRCTFSKDSGTAAAMVG